MVYGKCHSVLHKQLQNVYTRQKEKKKKEKIQIITSGKYCRDLQRSKAACQLFVNVVYKEIKQGGRGARKREIRRRQWKSKFSAIIDFVLKQLLPDREREKDHFRDSKGNYRVICHAQLLKVSQEYIYKFDPPLRNFHPFKMIL